MNPSLKKLLLRALVIAAIPVVAFALFFLGVMAVHFLYGPIRWN